MVACRGYACSVMDDWKSCEWSVSCSWDDFIAYGVLDSYEMNCSFLEKFDWIIWEGEEEHKEDDNIEDDEEDGPESKESRERLLDDNFFIWFWTEFSLNIFHQRSRSFDILSFMGSFLFVFCVFKCSCCFAGDGSEEEDKVDNFVFEGCFSSLSCGSWVGYNCGDLDSFFSRLYNKINTEVPLDSTN